MNDLITQHLDTWTSAITSKATAGRGTSDKQTAYGIKKLRELILELAVRGKLVPQDLNDVPAGVLLEKITAEKMRWASEGKVKKQKPLPEVNDEEKPFDLPENWKWTKLGNISFINPRNEADDKTMASFVPMSFITTLHTGEHEQEVREWKEIKNGYTHFANGDIGVAKITPCFENSKAVVFSNLSSGIGAGTTELHIARPYGDTLCARYILIYLKSPEFLIVGESKMTGTAGQKRIPKEFFAENPLPLPPLAEQHRIVAKVDELMALCDQLEQRQADSIAAHQTLVQTLLDTLTQAADAAEFEQAWNRIADHFDTLFTTEHSIDQLKQTLLQLAVMGKLVPQDPNDEPASVLLEKVTEEKERLIKENQLKKDKPLPALTKEEITFPAPNGWIWTKFGVIAEFINGDRSKNYPNRSEYVDTGVAWINTGHIEPNGRLTTHDMNFISREKFNSLNSGKIQKGDIVYCLRGATFGKTAFVEPYEEGAIASSLMIIRSFIISLNQYIFQYLISPFGKQQLFRFDNGSAQPNLSAGNVMLYAFPLPPLAEQHRIVAKVDELMALCDTLKARIAAAQTTQLQLADAIVEQAVA